MTEFRNQRHPEEEIFENYVFQRLSDQDVEDLEEHLLVCEECRVTLCETEDQIRLMKAATAAYIAKHPLTRAGFRKPAFVSTGMAWNVAAAAVLLLSCLTALLSWRSPMGDPKTIALDSYRGDTMLVPARQPLDLKIDLKDVPKAPGYRVEVVNAAGGRVWFGGTPAHVPQGLEPGTYWVRLSTNAGAALREYGIRAEKTQ
jgi:hypothetical protein